MRLINSTTNQVMHPSVTLAASFLQRCKGLIGERNISRGLIIPTRGGIHTFFMAEPIDVLALDNYHRVIRIRMGVAPNRIIFIPLVSAYVLELPADTCSKVDISLGDSIVWL